MRESKQEKPDGLTVYRDDEGVVVFDYGTQIITLEAARKSNQLHRSLDPKGPEPILVFAESARGVRTELVDYAASEEVTEITAALALVATSKVAEVIGNAYISFHKNPYPTRLFTDACKARAWLKKVAEEQVPRLATAVI